MPRAPQGADYQNIVTEGRVESGTATQLITVGATLGGVILTLLANAYLERRRARDTRDLESMRFDSEHARWIRDERLKAYAGLSDGVPLCGVADQG